MDKKVISIYMVPVLISLVLGVIVVALGVIKQPILITAAFSGAILGTFVLDFEYILSAFLLDPQKDFSKTLLGFIKHGDLANAAKHIHYHKDEAKELSLNSGLFQIVLAFLAIFVVFSTKSIFAKMLVLSIFTNSIYVFFEYMFKDRLADWFWTFKTKPTKQGASIYIAVMIAVLALCILIISKQ